MGWFPKLNGSDCSNEAIKSFTVVSVKGNQLLLSVIVVLELKKDVVLE